MTKPYTGPADDTCAMRGGKLCSKVCPTCKFQIHIRGLDPQSGGEIDIWNCSFALMPILTIENSKKQHETGAAVESFRNEVTKRNGQMRADANAMLSGPRIVAQEMIAPLRALNGMLALSSDEQS